MLVLPSLTKIRLLNKKKEKFTYRPVSSTPVKMNALQWRVKWPTWFAKNANYVPCSSRLKLKRGQTIDRLSLTLAASIDLRMRKNARAEACMLIESSDSLRLAQFPTTL